MSPAARATKWGSLAIAISIAMLASAPPACTLFDGWSDLQGGPPPRGDAGKGRDDSGDPSDDDAAATDARADQSSSGGPDDVVCGAARCPKGQACCLSTGARTGQLQCTTRGLRRPVGAVPRVHAGVLVSPVVADLLLQLQRGRLVSRRLRTRSGPALRSRRSHAVHDRDDVHEHRGGHRHRPRLPVTR